MTSPGGPRRLACLAYFLSLAILLGGALPVFGWVLIGNTWPTGDIRMYLSLNRAPIAFQDGSASWSASATDALNLWNQNLGSVKFVDAGPGSAGAYNSQNNVSFSTTMYGKTWPAGVLAVTIDYSVQGSGVFTETDVIFNDNLHWDSYRGAVQGGGVSGTYDFHRVALHEFGHVLGLDHPDQAAGQHVVAIMNSTISNLDHLADDDIAGAAALYGGTKITSPLSPTPVRSGDNFSYQITANNSPSSYSATGLPPGLQLNTGTGLITGNCPTSGTFPVDVTATGPSGTAAARVQVTITPWVITSSPFLSIQIGASLSYQIAAANSPTSYDATGLPAGLQINTGTGLISGTPEASGTFTLRVYARSATSEAAGNVTLQVSPPRITSGLSIGVELGDPLSFQITATNNPTSFSATGLPSGLQIDPSSGLISGTSTVAGDFLVAVSAQTAFGPATANVVISIRPPRITSFAPPPQDIGTTYNYQVTASNHPYQFSATGLPPGLVIDSATGKITGVAELSGTYQVAVTAVGATGTATGTFSITVAKLELTDTPVKKMSLQVFGTIVADPNRPRIYAVTTNGVAVIDTDSLSVIQTVLIGSLQADLSVSVDGSKLWVTGYYDSRIRAIDLNTLSITTTLNTPSLYPRLIREGADGYLYVTDYNQSSVSQIDPVTGATVSQLNPRVNNTGGFWSIDVSADHSTLYLLSLTTGSQVARYHLSAGNAPALIQKVDATNTQSMGRRLAVDPTHGSLSVATQNLTGKVDPTQGRSANDLSMVERNYVSAALPTNIAYSFDGTLFFQSMQQRSGIDLFRTSDGQLARTITLPDRAVPSGDNYINPSLAVDRSNSYLFVASSSPSTGLYVFSLKGAPPPIAPPHSLLNIATRMRAEPGENAMIGGFIVTGQGPKQLALRAIGPSLPTAGKLADPVLQLYDATGTLVAQNDNWNAHRAAVLATGIPPSDEHEAVVVATVDPGSYTAVVRGVNDSSGVALIEAYDLSPGSGSKLANISTRGKVEAGDNVMIGGFILGGDQTTGVVVRGLGPSLANYNIGGALSDPRLEVYDGNGSLIAQDDEWRMFQEQALLQTGLAPTDDRETAMILFLQPGAYTAIVRGQNNSTGVGLVEVYNLETN